MNATSVSHKTETTYTPPDEIFIEAQVAARAMSSDELLAWIEVLALDCADPDPNWPGPVGRHLAGERLRAVEAELERRTHIFAMPGSTAARYAADRETWAQLAHEVRERVDCAEVLLLLGHPPRTVGREMHGPCPACGEGDDRLLVRREKVWCRQCGLKTDAIGLVRSFMPGLAGFRDAVRFLARLAEVEAPR
jgi:hypothetical protein